MDTFQRILDYFRRWDLLLSWMGLFLQRDLLGEDLSKQIPSIHFHFDFDFHSFLFDIVYQIEFRLCVSSSFLLKFPFYEQTLLFHCIKFKHTHISGYKIKCLKICSVNQWRTFSWTVCHNNDQLYWEQYQTNSWLPFIFFFAPDSTFSHSFFEFVLEMMAFFQLFQ